MNESKLRDGIEILIETNESGSAVKNSMNMS